MSLKPIRPAPLPPSKNNCASSALLNSKHDDNNNKHVKQRSNESLHPTVIRPKQNGQQQGRKKKPPPPRPAPPKVNRSGIGKSNLHGKQNSLHISSLLEEDLANIFGDCNNANSEKFKSKPQCQSVNRKSSQPPRFIRRSMKKRAPNPLGNSTKSNSTLIDFDSPVFGPYSSSNDVSQTLRADFISTQEKSLLDLDDPFLNSSNNQVVNLPKSNSLQIENTFQDVSIFTMNGTEKCENYVATINSVSYSQARTNEKLQKKSTVAPQSNFEYMGKENSKVGSAISHQPTIIYPIRSSKNNLPSSQSDGQICSSSFDQKQNVLSHSTISSRGSQQKDTTLCANAEQTLNLNWENASTFSNCYNTSTETDHCASPFSDISSHHTISSVDSSDELCFTSESLPEPEFPPPPPPENFVTENDSETTTNTHKASQICKALYDFEAESSEELSFKQGEFIHFEKKVTDDWWQGCISGRRGIFPSSFVEIINNQKVPEPEQKSCIVRALYQFDGEEEGDLSFKADDEIRVLSRINKDWLFGECNCKQGQFPASFVKQKQMHSNKGLCIARYPFVGENSDELSFEEGDKIIVTEYINNDWWRGMVSNNNSKIGIFPCAFVEKIDSSI